MALANVQIEFGASSGVSVAGSSVPLLALLGSSQNRAASTVSTALAPSPANSKPILSIWAAAPIFFALGPNVTTASAGDATKRRYMDPTFGRYDVVCEPGDKFVWVAA
jgi:hypothetical protein